MMTPEDTMEALALTKKLGDLANRYGGGVTTSCGRGYASIAFHPGLTPDVGDATGRTGSNDGHRWTVYDIEGVEVSVHHPVAAVAEVA